MCEKLNILPANHFGARPGRTTTDSIHLLMKTVKDAWRKGKVASILFLDVKGAFPSVAIDRLLHNMRKRGIPRQYVAWMKRRLRRRKTSLLFDDYATARFIIENGLDQGDPFSGICYLIYNADMLKIPILTLGEWVLLFVDDAAVIVIGKDFFETHEKLRNIMNRPGGIFEWARLHNCEFGIEKFQLVDATRKRVAHAFVLNKKDPMPRRNLQLGPHVIKSKPAVKFLGVMVDNTLSWNAQCAAALAKGHDWMVQFGRLAKASKGVSSRYMRQLYLSIAIPRMLYAADIFLTPQRQIVQAPNARKSGRAIINKLASVQRRAAIMITGAMNSTPGDVLDVLANLLPFHLLVDQHRQRAALRLATRPEGHPLHLPVRNAARHLVQRHRTPLHELMHTYKMQPEKTEHITAARQSTKWVQHHKIVIPETKKRAVYEDEHDMTPIKVYTDGSGIDGQIGASAVLFRDGEVKSVLRYRLGSAKRHTVYEGECVGAIMGLKLILQERNVRTASICIDSQAAITATTLIKPAAGHYLLDAFHYVLDREVGTHEDFLLTIRWTPGHQGTIGNERADEEAKKAARGDTSEKRRLPAVLRETLPRSKSATKQAYNAKLKKSAKAIWTSSPHFERMNEYDSSAPSSKFCDMLAKLPRKHGSLITQMRTGHAPLAHHLHRITKADSPVCPACHQYDETVAHFLLHCPAHERARNTLLRQGGPGPRHP
ncbi:putative RNA-directed DNA polymerase from transposon X-element [Hypsizygus marmoreus]|uniref:RNA-directed DNA polymerase from transposon X-element n=1 Tax=Hypsizygus marmoreus TaxID=39966 RepID=A0A369KAU1_HYPMA|nr:putative RNA-directed DNA polymerase from transposon X-element [Hypsizygus marmoreus]